VATKIAKVLFIVAGLLFVVAAIVPTFRGGSVETGRLGFAVTFFLLALALRPRRAAPPPSGPGA